jgi:hypothetical protein
MNGRSVYGQILVLVSLALLAIAALWWNTKTGPTGESPQEARPAVRVQVRAVADGDTLLDRAVAVPDSSTVKTALEAAAHEGGVPLGVREYDFGVLVVNIGSRAAGPDGDWTYRLNDSLPPLGVHQCRVHDGDRVDFHFGKNASDTAAASD